MSFFRKCRTGCYAAVLLWLWGCSGTPEGGAQEVETADAPVHGPEHSDHNPKHGGIFFMALDYRHHLEGTLVPPGVFRLYLYDARTRPLPPEKVRQARAFLHWGMFPDPPALPLQVSADGLTLELALQRELEFPVDLTLLIHFPGSDPEEKPELFNFTFEKYSEE